MKTLLFDHASDGHHMSYNNSIIQGLLDADADLELSFLTCPTSEHLEAHDLEYPSLTKYIPHRIQLLLNYFPTRIKSILLTLFVLIYARAYGFKKIHFLYIDCCVLTIFLFLPLTLGLQLSGTLHRFPSHKSKSIMLTQLLKWGILHKLVVHGEYTRNRLIHVSADVENCVESLFYPHLQQIESDVQKSPLDHYKNTEIINQLRAYKRPYLLAFGGLRHEKGIDFLLASLACMEQEATLLIVGQEDSFSKSDLLKMIAQYDIAHKVFLDIRYIPNEQVDFYFNLTDVIVLPYRKSFLGQSGPLTEGIARSKLVIGPNHGEIGFTLQHYEIGLVYESEDVKALAYQIDQAILQAKIDSAEIRENQTEYHKLVNVTTFKNRYSKVILANKTPLLKSLAHSKKLPYLEVVYYVLYVEAITNLYLFSLL